MMTISVLLRVLHMLTECVLAECDEEAFHFRFDEDETHGNNS